MKHNTVGHRTADNVALRAATLALCALSLIACGDDDVGDAPIIMIDAGADMITPPPVDMFVPRDMGTACAPSPITPLPAAALPRCSAATQATVVACGLPSTPAIGMCIGNALTADTTPALTSMGATINCGTCFNIQQLSCFYAAGCDTQLDQLQCCLTANSCTNANACPACMTQLGAVQTCAGMNLECFDANMGELANCFGDAPTDGGVPDTDAGTPVDGGDIDGGTETDAGTDGGPTTPTP